LWPYAAGIAVFAGYWLWHGSVSLSRSQARAHPDLALHSGNLFFMLLLIGIFFLPLMPIWLSRYARSVMARPALLALPVLLGVLYATTFKVDHPYNFTLPEIILRNSVLVLVAQNRYAFVAFGVVAVAAACAISQVRWQRPSFILILLVSMLFVSASWLIEQRYYLIPIALLLALRVTENRRAERMLLALWMPVAVGFLYGMLSYQFFL
jgi:alpha-1,2-glucosyltransferase